MSRWRRSSLHHVPHPTCISSILTVFMLCWGAINSANGLKEEVEHFWTHKFHIIWTESRHGFCQRSEEKHIILEEQGSEQDSEQGCEQGNAQGNEQGSKQNSEQDTE
jgi:hypothetical protein